MTYATPGVYVEEISTLPPSVAQVETAIPVFIGYTEKAPQGKDKIGEPTKISSLKEFEELFGKTPPVSITNHGTENSIELDVQDEEVNLVNSIEDPYSNLTFRLYYALQLFYANGGGEAYVISCGKASGSNIEENFSDALKKLEKEDEPTMILMPDLIGLGKSKFYNVYKKALTHCSKRKDRIVLIDVLSEPKNNQDSGKFKGDKEFSDLNTDFRSQIGNRSLSYGAVYYPWLETNLHYVLDEDEIKISFDGTKPEGFGDEVKLRKYENDLKDNPTDQEEKDFFKNSLFHVNSEVYNQIKKEINNYRVIMPPSPAIAGIYAYNDRTQGVWYAPANISLTSVKRPMVKIDDDEQENMNVDTSGKSVNAIREFSGRGILVWGARTLDGNSNEWRYVSVRRFFAMVEESVKKACQRFVFKPNDANTWKTVKAMIENFLTLQWRAGALMGAKPEQAFYVKVGLGETMTFNDVNNGKMIVEIGMAAVKPAEFIILRFSHKMVEA